MPQDIKQGRMLYGGAGGCAQWQQYTNKGYKKSSTIVDTEIPFKLSFE